MSFLKNLEIVIRARYPLIYISSTEEERVETTINTCVQKLFNTCTIYSWDFINGYRTTNAKDNGIGTKNPLQALELIEKITSNTPAIFILKDFDSFLNDVAINRKIKNLSKTLRVQPKNIILLSSKIKIPENLRDNFSLIEFQLPNQNEIKNELERLALSLKVEIDDDLLETFTLACQGLSIEQIRKIFSRILVSSGKINEESLEVILLEKQQIIKQTEILELTNSNQNLTAIGGLNLFKTWIKKRSKAFTQTAQNYGLPTPKGILLVGIQGTGKSLAAKVIANEWNLSLLRLDVGRIFAGVVGESEARVREMITLSESLAPCIVWIDEIDKSFGRINSSGDSGTSNRVLATFLTWLSEKTSPVFVVATANNISALPPEMLRKGRFDEIFFVGLPNAEERKEIFDVQLKAFRPETYESFNTQLLSNLSKNFSGAEIRQVIVEAMHDGFWENREFDTNDIAKSIENFVPLYYTNKEEIVALQEWAASGRVKKAS